MKFPAEHERNNENLKTHLRLKNTKDSSRWYKASSSIEISPQTYEFLFPNHFFRQPTTKSALNLLPSHSKTLLTPPTSPNQTPPTLDFINILLQSSTARRVSACGETRCGSPRREGRTFLRARQSSCMLRGLLLPADHVHLLWQCGISDRGFTHTRRP